MRFTSILILLICMLTSCSPNKQAQDLGVIFAFAEVVKSGVKPLALSEPMTSDEISSILPQVAEIAAGQGVKIYRESALIKTDLFNHDQIAGKEVLIIYAGTALDRYLSLKADLEALDRRGIYVGQAREEIARRFGRLLGYSSKGINQLLTQNTDFRTLSDFGIQASNVFLYYKNLEQATAFYLDILGLELVADYTMAKILRIGAESYLILVDEAHGMHTSTEPKSVALALITDQLAEWNSYLKYAGIPIKYDYHPKEGGAHDGFVIEDPEGYLLEFETFKQHPENEKFLPVLNQNMTLYGNNLPTRKAPEYMGFSACITWLYYEDLLGMQQFMEEVMGLEMVVDQGWAKIYQITPSGFVGLVDGRRGMCTSTKEKGVTFSYFVEDVEAWFDYVKKTQRFPRRSESIEIGPESKYKAFVGYDPEGYFLEFDTFQTHPDNTILLDYLAGIKEKP